jgi:hypothetical protein
MTHDMTELEFRDRMSDMRHEQPRPFLAAALADVDPLDGFAALADRLDEKIARCLLTRTEADRREGP